MVSKYNIPQSENEWKKKLSPEQFKVLREKGTEPSFIGKYWDNKEEGLYVDIVSGEPLFSSFQKFDSSCGWASFDRPLELLFSAKMKVNQSLAIIVLNHRVDESLSVKKLVRYMSIIDTL